MKNAQPNRALILARERNSVSRYSLAHHVANLSEGMISRDSAYRTLVRIESGETRNPSDLYQTLICKALNASPTNIFGRHGIGHPEVTGDYAVTCRKYVPIVLQAESASAVGSEFEYTEIDGFPARRGSLEWPYSGTFNATIFDFGVLVAEITQHCRFASLAELAVWRHTSYEEDRPRVADAIRRAWPNVTASPEYVLGTWWVTESGWSGDDLETAVRIMSTPSILLDRRGTPTPEELLAGAEVAERSLMEDGLDGRLATDDVAEFGTPGVALGCATWSGVAYAPLAADRALHPSELGDWETLCQGLWALCDAVCTAVERGDDPAIAPDYGWKWLRGVATRISRPRPTETRQVRAMRDAVVRTSQLAAMLPGTVDILRDAPVDA